ncbi:MAG: hypothetical protein C4K49_11620 [Candidatus Thorarchaeota archaeon]|nr:MAG: hypothetical protein C4K49_11620 [Candidatus Thorarchaeota archaeon]
MSEDQPQSTGEGQRAEERSAPAKRQFNPIGSYFYIIGLTIAAYAMFYAFGYLILIVVMLYFQVSIFREVSFILASFNYGFPRTAAYFNAGHSAIFFGILTLNGYTIVQYGVPLILPEIGGLTLVCPLFIMMALLGCRNIRSMYVPVPPSQP